MGKSQTSVLLDYEELKHRLQSTARLSTCPGAQPFAGHLACYQLPSGAWMLAGLGPMTRVVTERLPNLSAPLTRALVAICPKTWKMGKLDPKYPDLNRTNEHRYIIV